MPESDTSVAALLREEPRRLQQEADRRGYRGLAVFVEQLYDDLRQVVSDMEGDAKYYRKDKEEKLSAAIGGCLRCFGYTATCEAHHRGHIDLTIECRRLHYKWLAEAKIWKGTSWLTAGMRELLYRYLSGTQPHAGFLIYFREKDVKKKLADWVAKLKEKGDIRAKVVASGPGALELLSTHRHMSGYDVSVRHFGFQLYAPPRKPAGRSKKGKRRRRTS